MSITNVLSLFDGISCGQIALNRAGIQYENYYASEIDKHAISVTQANYPNTVQLGSVVDVKSADLPSIDLLMGGSPCQGFSFSGRQLNFEDKRSVLFFSYVKILREVKPKWFLLENVPMKREYTKIISDYLGVEPIEINSSLVSAQNRKRLYWTNIPVGGIEDRGIGLKDLVGEYDGIWVYPRGFNKGGVQSYKGKSPSITTSSWEHNFFIYRNGEKEAFTQNLCERLQTVPEGYTKVLSKSKAIKALGNAWTVDVIAHILKGLDNG
jgi:site-specific DNA-cytosine methylase